MNDNIEEMSGDQKILRHFLDLRDVMKRADFRIDLENIMRNADSINKINIIDMIDIIDNVDIINMIDIVNKIDIIDMIDIINIDRYYR